jgi:excisionase family DNA binding protein
VTELTPFAVSIPEAARLAGIGRSSIYKAISSRRLTIRKIGRRSLVEVAALREWLSRLPEGRDRAA